MTVPTTSRAAMLRGYGEAVVIDELPVPPLEPGAALVSVDAATVCGTDVHIRNGRFEASKLPLVLGHESTGTIVALRDRERDANDQPLREGDRVVFAYPWCGRCYWCTIAREPTMCTSAQMYGWGPSDGPPFLTGAFSEYVYVRPECHVLRVPESLDTGVVASSTCALRTVFHGFERLHQAGRPLGPDDTVVILGSGAVGLYALAVCMAHGAGQVILAGAPQARLDIGTRWGADVVVDVTATTLQQRRELVLDHTQGRGADVVIDCAGPPQAFREALEFVRRAGRVLEIGIGDLSEVAVPPYYFNIKMISVIGNLSGSVPHFYRALRFLQRHAERFDFAELLSGRYDLEHVEDALAAVASQEAIKPVITPSGA